MAPEVTVLQFCHPPVGITFVAVPICVPVGEPWRTSIRPPLPADATLC